MDPTPFMPTKSEQDKKTSTVKTPLCGMSSSLKERLKKCGRFHPATPPSSHHTTPTRTDQHHTPQNTVTGEVADHSPQQLITPTGHVSGAAVREHSPRTTGRTLLQPRNILKEKTLSGSQCRNMGGDFENEPVVTSCRTSAIVHNKDQSKPPDSHEQLLRSLENSPSIPNSGIEPVISPSSFGSTHSANAETASVPHEKQQSLQKEVPVLSSSVELREGRKKLTADLACHKETLRKLLMIKTYRAKHSLGELQALIDKWRSVSQQAVLDLHKLTHDPQLSLTKLVSQLGIDQQLLRYNEEDECFEEG